MMIRSQRGVNLKGQMKSKVVDLREESEKEYEQSKDERPRRGGSLLSFFNVFSLVPQLSTFWIEVNS